MLKTRLLAHTTVIDRMVQQEAIIQVLSPLLDPQFSNHSYGFRASSYAQSPISKAKEFVKSGKSWVVNIDIEALFNNVNHDIF